MTFRFNWIWTYLTMVIMLTLETVIFTVGIMAFKMVMVVLTVGLMLLMIAMLLWTVEEVVLMVVLTIRVMGMVVLTVHEVVLMVVMVVSTVHEVVLRMRPFQRKLVFLLLTLIGPFFLHMRSAIKRMVVEVAIIL